LSSHIPHAQPDLRHVRASFARGTMVSAMPEVAIVAMGLAWVRRGGGRQHGRSRGGGTRRAIKSNPFGARPLGPV